jgi:hypothetical protein
VSPILTARCGLRSGSVRRVRRPAATRSSVAGTILGPLIGMRLVTLVVLGGLTAGCATTTATTAYWDTAYWDRRGATLAQLASESETCYREAVAGEYPSALPASEPAAGDRLLARSTPPPALWKRSPRQAGFERYDEQLRYERCMRERGWTASARP